MPGVPKGTTALRRVPSSLSKVSTPPAALPSQSSKSTKKSKVVKFKISKEHLSTLAIKTTSTKVSDPKVKASPKTTSKPLILNGPTPTTHKSESETSSSKAGERDGLQSPGKSASDGEKRDPNVGEKREAAAAIDEDGKGKAKGVQRKRPKV